MMTYISVTNIDLSRQTQKQFQENHSKWQINKAHWFIFKNLIQKSDISIIDSRHINSNDDVDSFFTNSVIEKAKNSILKSSRKPSKKFVSWWYDELKNTIREKKKT